MRARVEIVATEGSLPRQSLHDVSRLLAEALAVYAETGVFVVIDAPLVVYRDDARATPIGSVEVTVHA